MRHRCVDRGLVCRHHLRGHRVWVTEGVEHRHRLRGPKCQIEPGHPRPSQPLPRSRRPPSQSRRQRLRGDGALKTERLGAVPEPAPRRLLRPRVVVLHPRRQRQVVRRLPRRQLPDVQHERDLHPQHPPPGRPRVACWLRATPGNRRPDPPLAVIGTEGAVSREPGPANPVPVAPGPVFDHRRASPGRRSRTPLCKSVSFSLGFCRRAWLGGSHHVRAAPELDRESRSRPGG